jgi:hypothetical protein
MRRHPRLVAVVSLAALGLVVLLVARGRSVRHARGPEAPEEEAPAQRRPSSAPLPQPQAGALGRPAWTQALQEQPAQRAEVTLRNGLKAVMTASKSIYPAKQSLELDLRLFDKDGRSIIDRPNVEVQAFDTSRQPPQIRRFAFTPDTEQPGRYRVVVPAAREAKELTVVAVVSESGGLPKPNEEVQALMLKVPHDGQVSLGAVADAVSGPDGLQVTVGSFPEASVRGTVRAEVRDFAGRTLGEATATVDLQAGEPQGFQLRFGPIPEAAPGSKTELFIVNLSLYADDRLVDYRTDPVPLNISHKSS